MNEGAGSLAYDVSGHGNHGALKNMSPNAQNSGWGGSKFGGGLNFDGTDDYVDCGTRESLCSDYLGWSLEMWCFLTSTAKRYFFGFSASYSWKSVCGGTSWRTRIDGSGTGDDLSYPTISTNIWTHLVFVFDGVNDIKRIYKNGVVAAENTPTSHGPGYIDLSAVDRAYIGTDVQSYWYKGTIGAVRIYTRVLSTEESLQLYHNPFCNLIRTPAWQLYSPAVGGLSIPVAMHQYEMLRA
jgi:hypothetical protein